MKTKDILTMGMAIIAIAVVVTVAGSVVQVSQESQQTQLNDDVEVEGESGSIDRQGWGTVENITFATTSLEDQVRLSGASDSYVEASGSMETDDTWALCSWAAADQSVVDGDESRTIVGYDTATVYYNGTSDEYVGWWYDEGARETYDATVPAPDPTNQSLVCMDHNATHLTIARNTTVGQEIETSGSPTVADPPGDNWHGTLEETRVLDYSLATAQRQELVDNPVLALNDSSAPVARLTYDVRDRSTTSVPVYFAGSSAKISNASFEDGFDAVPIDEGVDYSLSGVFSPKFEVLDGGVLDDDGEVAYVTFIAGGGPFNILGQLQTTGGAALSLLVVGLLIKGGMMVLKEIDEF